MGSGIRDLGSEKKPFPDPGSRGQKGTGSPIPDPDPQHCNLPINQPICIWNVMSIYQPNKQSVIEMLRQFTNQSTNL